MTRHENILSFDEARSRGSVSSRRSPNKPTPARQNIPRHTIPPQQQASRAAVARPAAHTPQRLTYDPAFEASFTATARSGSYQSVSRPQARSMHAAAPTGSTVAQRSMGQRPAANRTQARSFTDRERFSVPGEASDRHRAQNTPGNRADTTDGRADKADKKTLAHRYRAAKAERQFNKTFGSDEPVKPGPEQSSRPALYEMKMGKTHKKSSRMQNTAAGKKRTGIGARLGSIFSRLDPRSPRFFSRALIACATFILAVVMLYQPVANYYQEIRQQQQLEAEYAVVADYYSSLKSEVEYLNTKEGLEEYVREELGWVKSGEQVATVEGLQPRDTTSKSGSITSDLSNAVPTPATWYSGVLDVIFGYNKS